MPIFEYKCSKCEKSFEILLRGKEIPQCPFCGSKDLRKLMSRFSAHSDSGAISGAGSSGCGTCSGGTCATCGK